jgi:hypothetical protein
MSTHSYRKFALHELAEAPPGEHHEAKHGQRGPHKGATCPT